MARRNMTHRSVAVRVGIHETHWSRLVSRRIGVSARVRDRLLRVFRPVKWDDLFIIPSHE